MKDSLQIKEALELSAKEITMDEAVAKETLLKAVIERARSVSIASLSRLCTQCSILNMQMIISVS